MFPATLSGYIATSRHAGSGFSLSSDRSKSRRSEKNSVSSVSKFSTEFFDFRLSFDLNRIKFKDFAKFGYFNSDFG